MKLEETKEIMEWMKINGNIHGDWGKHEFKSITVAADSSSHWEYKIPEGYVFFLSFITTSFKSNTTYRYRYDNVNMEYDDIAKDEPLQDYGDNRPIWTPPLQVRGTIRITISNTGGTSQTYNAAINGFLRREGKIKRKI